MTLGSAVEVDGACFGGYVRPENRSEDRKDRRLSENRNDKRRVVVVMRERRGRTVPIVVRGEDDAVPTIRARVASGTTVHADEASTCDQLHAVYDMKRVNHRIAFVNEGACTNQAESYFSRLRRAEWGQHHHVNGRYLIAYAGEMAWREDYRRRSTGELYQLATAAALSHPVSRVWKGYWQRSAS